MNMNKALTPLIIAILVLGSALSVGLFYLNSDRDDNGNEDTDIDPWEGDGSLEEDVKKRWKEYSGKIESPEIISTDPDIAKAVNGEALVKIAELEGLNNFTDSDEGTVGGNETNSGDDEKAGYAEEGVLDDADGGGAPEREVEEADLVKIIGDTLYVLNSYRGLLTIDLSDTENVHIAGQCPVVGYPVEMYVVDFLAIITVRTNYNFWYKYWNMDEENAEDDEGTGTIGTMIYIVNVADPADPVILKIVELEGFASESRRVGHVIYQATNTYGWYWYYGSGDEETIVTSIDFGDPRTVGMKDQVRFKGSSNEVHASSSAFYIAQPEWIYNYAERDYIDDEWEGENETEEEKKEEEEKPRDDALLWEYPFDEFYEYYTNITYLDISDPDGDIIKKDNFKVPGQLNDKYQMDEYNGMFRLVTHFWSGIGESRLYIVDISNPGDIAPLGSLLVDDAGSLMATRFAGERAYTIHLPRSIDPLDVLDLSDPENPKLCDVFEMPGWVTHMEVRGMKILALGVDDSEDQRNVAVSLFDVSDAYNVEMLDRVRLGGDYAYSSANWEPKALTIDDTHNMIIVPFNSWSNEDRRSSAGVQIVKFDLEEGDLVLKGSVSGPHSIERTRVFGDSILATSFKNLQVIDISDLETPEILRSIDLCINVKDVVPAGEHFIQMSQDWYDGNVVLRTVERVDDLQALHSVSLESNWARIFNIGGRMILAANVYDDEKWFGKLYEIEVGSGGSIYLDLIDQLPDGHSFSDNSHYYDWYGWGLEEDYGRSRYSSRYIYYPGYNSERFIVLDDALVYYHIGDHPYSDWVYDKDLNRYVPTPEEKGNDTIFVFDLPQNNDNSAVSTIELETYSFVGMTNWENDIYIQHRMSAVEVINVSKYDNWSDSWYENYYYEWYYRNYAVGVDCNNPSAPVVMGDYNIPGKIVGAGKDVLFTVSEWSGDQQNVTLNTLTLYNDSAKITCAVNLGSGWLDITMDGNTAYVTERPYYYYYYYRGNEEQDDNTSLRVIDLSAPDDPTLVASITLEGSLNLEIVDERHLVFHDNYQSSLVVYSTSDFPDMSFETMVLLQGYGDPRIVDDVLYIPQEYYGALAVEL